ncbi:glycerol-3-phosphate dehydrogenase [Mycoplasma capricolum subsp. capripneumoniae]|uniref:Glycerol-3-phosphate dehydrogenase n=1 Tax=Mycoplasma capricolum subsp. capripneumoniae 87001 TaxID=1124992 RepID=A0A9N7B6G2_MYCCC|nr:glycerol-3-phosphate dehydrogenase [Mycoplasma capricolum]AJK51598.1 glycerol-3-phosphate dehydrogenase (NAD(P)+) [Mycoplasma capricolum subsp. capripneumoniae 87001]AOQ22247.1 glycerol-3-phosphate dehydrogenase [Mycoplasma capricolum subsp. capripneumoniae M1601]AQU77593.1 glycerol-3-phosphate dehydrogenase [Mycoplasma capricolum subsp. capripneumoniae]KEY84589.1 Glycerol-3-phosphate dehydrogenase [NAD(P)+] [Mycoplasma capricolum subsp. capripneumoniae 99108]QDL19712.1 glycerol-3-phosphate
MKKNITIIGSNAYSIALANILTDNHHNVIIYSENELDVNNINFNHIYNISNQLKINNKIVATTDLVASLENVEILILTILNEQLLLTINQIKKYLKNEIILINTIKGFDENNLDLLSNLIINQFSKTNLLKEFVCLYGPNNPSQIILKKPTTAMIISKNLIICEQLVKIFSNEYFLCYSNNDLITSQLVVYFIDLINLSLGILEGLGAESNTKASLITVIINLIYQIAKNYNAKLETFFNFATLANLIENVLDTNNKYFLLGIDIVKLNNLTKALKKNNLTIDQIQVVRIAYLLCDKYEIHNEFINTLYKILYNNVRPIALLNHSFKGVWLV